MDNYPHKKRERDINRDRERDSYNRERERERDGISRDRDRDGNRDRDGTIRDRDRDGNIRERESSNRDRDREGNNRERDIINRDRDRDNGNRERRDSKERHSKESPRISSRGNSNSSSPRYNSSRSGSAYVQKPHQRGTSGNSPYQNTSNHHHSSASKPNSVPPEHERRIKEILARAGEWTDHISSSGKKYYYNCRTEVSQWEKPKEWIEREKLQKALGGKLPSFVSQPNAQMQSKGNERHSSESRPQTSTHQEHPQQHSHRTQEKSSSSSHSTGRRPSAANQSQSRTLQTNQSPLSKPNQSDTRGSHISVRQSNLSEQSPSASTKESRNNHSSRWGNSDVPVDKDRSVLHSPSLNRKISEGTGTENVHRDSPGSNRSRNASVSVATDMYGRLKNLVTAGTPGKLNDSPKIQSTPSPAPTASPLPTPSPKLITRTPVNNQHYPQRQRRKSLSRSPSLERISHTSNNDRKDDGHDRVSSQSPMSIASVSNLSSPARSHPSPSSVTSTPRSYTSHSAAEKRDNNMEVTEIKEDVPPDKQKGPSVPDVEAIVPKAEVKGEEKVEVDVVKNDEKSNEEAAVESVAPRQPESAVVKEVVTKPKEDDIHFKDVQLSSSAHIAFFKEGQIRHQSQWPSDQIERQAQIVSRESYRLGVESYSQVTVDLKFARSLVRTTEIQANIQESRILFLRQQVKDLMKLKNENAYMA